MVGIRNSAPSEKHHLDAELNLDKAITQVCQSETVKLQQPLLHGIPDTLVGLIQRAHCGTRPINVYLS